MMDSAKAISALLRIDSFSRRKTSLSRFAPLSHLLVTLVFTAFVLSVDNRQPAILAAFAVYPVITSVLGDVPFGMIIKRVLFVLPAVALLGIFNPLLNQTEISFGGVTIPEGWLLFISLIFKCALTISGTLILICVSGIEGVCASLRNLRVPDILISQLAFTYRYIHLLCEEVIRVLTAYRLRAPRARGISVSLFGPICGGLFLRSAKYAENIYAAMRCRGYNGNLHFRQNKGIFIRDFVYILLWTLFFIISRLFNLPEIIGNLFF